MRKTISANELKTNGVSLLEKITEEQDEAIITVRGKQKFVVLTIDEYNRLRECELEAAYLESIEDLKEGRIYEDSVDDHLKRIKDA